MNKFLATDKQKDFILYCIDYLEDYKQIKGIIKDDNIIKRLDTMAKKEASDIISVLLDLIELSEYYDNDEKFWK